MIKTKAQVCLKGGKLLVRTFKLSCVMRMQKEEPKSDMYNSRYALQKLMASNQCQKGQKFQIVGVTL